MTEFGSDVHKLQNSKIKQKTIFEVIPNTQGMFKQSNELTDIIDKSFIWDEGKSNFTLSLDRKLYQCPVEACCRLFREKGNLRTHYRVHTGERPFKCNFPSCGKTFITLGNLKSHLCNHTGEKPFSCPYQGCDKKYSRYCRLKIHQRTHGSIIYFKKDEKPFKCPFQGCTRSFNEKGNLKTHFRIHSGEKPYVCTYEGCGQSFKAHGHLKDHIKRHYNIRPYKCSLCDARFARTSTLKIHSHTHTGEKPHQCPYPGCNKRFSEKGNMKTHMKIHANDGVKEQGTNISSTVSLSNKDSNIIVSNDIPRQSELNLIDKSQALVQPNMSMTNISLHNNNNDEMMNLVKILELLSNLNQCNNFLLNTQDYYTGNCFYRPNFNIVSLLEIMRTNNECNISPIINTNFINFQK